MSANETVFVACDLDSHFFETTLGKHGQKFLSNYEYGLLTRFKGLSSKGWHTLLTCLRGYGDVRVPYSILKAQQNLDSDHEIKIHCILEKPGDEKALRDDARFVWENAHKRSFQKPLGHEDIPFEQAVIQEAGCMLSAMENPETNSFHLAAAESNMPIYHHTPAEYHDIGVSEWKDTDQWGMKFAKSLGFDVPDDLDDDE